MTPLPRQRSPRLSTTAFTAALACAVLCACTTSPERAAQKWDRDSQRLATVLRARTDPDSLAAVSLLVLSKHPADAQALMARAAATADRADLAWLHMSVCGQTPGCESTGLEERLRHLDPDNGAGWMGALHRASTPRDEAGIDAALSAMGRTTRFDVYWTSLAARLSRAIAASGQLRLPIAITLVMGQLAALAIPAYQDSVNACKGEGLDRPGRREFCRAVAASFRNGDTFMTEMIGVAMAKRVWPADSAEYRDALEARRRYDYRTQAWGTAGVMAMLSPRKTEEYVQVLADHRREQEVLKAQLILHHIDPTPPADWPAKAQP